MPNWDRYCVECGFDGSYLDFQPQDSEIKEQRCVQPEPGGPTVREVFGDDGFRFTGDDEGETRICGGEVRWDEDDEDEAPCVECAVKQELVTVGVKTAGDVYLVLLRHPHDRWRIQNQAVLCALRDFIAHATGREIKAVQDEYEARALTEPNR